MKVSNLKAPFTILIISLLMIVPFAATAQIKLGPNPALGGYVIIVYKDGKHGVVAETTDQGIVTWNEVKNMINKPANHSADGKKFIDWRLPNRTEQNLMFKSRFEIVNFSNSDYWCDCAAIGNDGGGAADPNLYKWAKSFSNGEVGLYSVDAKLAVLAVRNF